MLWNKVQGDHAERISGKNTYIHIHTSKTQIRKIVNTHFDPESIELDLYKWSLEVQGII